MGICIRKKVVQLGLNIKMSIKVDNDLHWHIKWLMMIIVAKSKPK